MRNWKKTVVIFLLIICPIVIFVLVSFISGKAISEYVGFAVDSSERLYVGTNAGIEVYENGVRIKTINLIKKLCYENARNFIKNNLVK